MKTTKTIKWKLPKPVKLTAKQSKLGKRIIADLLARFAVCLVCLVASLAFGQGQVLNTALARKSGLHKLVKPTGEQAREFFNWQIAKHSVYREDGSAIQGWNEFRSSKGHTLHVGETYNPVQPLVAYELATQAMSELGINYSIDGVGSFNSDSQIFAQFAANETSGFKVKGKDYKGLFTMGKGNDETMPLVFWLTMVCVVCANTWRMAKRDARNGARMKQTKNSAERIKLLKEQIKALFTLQETVQQTLNRMAETKLSIADSERAFLGLLNYEKAEKEMKQTGRTRLQGELDRFKAEFNNPAMGTQGQTVEDWFNGVTYLETHADLDSPQAAKDLGAWKAKAEISSEFGTGARRKELAFNLAASPEAWQGLVATGDQMMQNLLAKPVIIAQSSVVNASDFNRLLAK